MASTDLIAHVKFLANKNGLNPDDYTELKILRREREALREGKTRAEFAQELLNEVQINTFGLSKCPNCGELTLTHEGGCEICKNCGYSRCG